MPEGNKDLNTKDSFNFPFINESLPFTESDTNYQVQRSESSTSINSEILNFNTSNLARKMPPLGSAINSTFLPGFRYAFTPNSSNDQTNPTPAEVEHLPLDFVSSNTKWSHEYVNDDVYLDSKTYLNVFSINIAGNIIKKKEEIISKITENDYDLVCIQEVDSTIDDVDTCNFPGYTKIKPIGDQNGFIRVLVLIKSNLDALTYTNFIEGNPECNSTCIPVCIRIRNQSFIFVNFYRTWRIWGTTNSNKVSAQLYRLRRLESYLSEVRQAFPGGKLNVVGDWNLDLMKTTLQENYYARKRGLKLINIITNIGLRHLGFGLTRMRHEQSPSALDFLVTNDPNSIIDRHKESWGINTDHVGIGFSVIVPKVSTPNSKITIKFGRKQVNE